MPESPSHASANKGSSTSLTEPGDLGLAKGEARCPGPTPADIIARDEAVAPQTPAALKTSRYEFLGDDDLAFSRYTQQSFYDAEIDGLWPRTWQWACREEQIPNPGDYYVYDIGPYSIFVTRTQAGDIKAFANSCPHRGMAFFNPGESGQAKQFFRCPFHGMSWELDGRLREIPCRWDFPHINDDDFGLSEVRSGVWGGFVFINLDSAAPSLADFLGVLPDHFAHQPLADRYIAMHTEKVLPGNWKMCMEGFLEAFHVLGTHPEALRHSSWANTQYDIFDKNVTRFLQPLSSGNPHYHRELSEQELFEGLGHKGQQLPEGMTARDAHAARLRQTKGQELGVDLSNVSTSVMLDSIEYHLFPNACFFPGIVIPLIYRFRPLTVDTCLHEILLLHPVPDAMLAKGQRPTPAEKISLGIDDSYTSVPNFPLAVVLDQDTENFARQSAGMKAALKPGQTLGNYQEARIRRFHMTLDEYLQ